MDIKVIAYSPPPPSKYTGDGNVNLVATVPKSDVLTSLGSNVFSPKATILCVGNPVAIVLIWHVTGIALSFVWKNISIDDTNIPFGSTISIDSARGSLQKNSSVNLSVNDCVWNVLVDVLFTVVLSVRFTCWISAFLIFIISSWTVFSVPSARKLVSAEDTLSSTLRESTELLDNLNVLDPVLNSGADVSVGSGINNDPIAAPFSSATNLTSTTFAIALLVLPVSIIFLAIYPWKSPRTCCCNDAVSILRTEVVAE